MLFDEGWDLCGSDLFALCFPWMFICIGSLEPGSAVLGSLPTGTRVQQAMVHWVFSCLSIRGCNGFSFFFQQFVLHWLFCKVRLHGHLVKGGTWVHGHLVKGDTWVHIIMLVACSYANIAYDGTWR